MNLKILNSREKKRLGKELNAEYGVDQSLFEGYDVMQSSKDVWITTRKCLEQNLAGLKTDSIGLQVMRGGRPTIHGVQLLFGSAARIELPEKNAKLFIDGEQINGEGRVASYNRHPIDLAEAVTGGIKRRKS
jgi:hypothetical protein